MGFSDDDQRYMMQALSCAKEGRGWVEPNPLVGAVLVRDGELIGEGAHLEYGGNHAEINCLEDAREKGYTTEGATMYVTLEPCAHEGKTGACAPELVKAGVERVVIAVEDPLWESHAEATALPSDAERGLGILRRAGIQTETGLCRDAALMQNAPFFKSVHTGRPLVIGKWAMTADGKIATRTGSSQWISGSESRQRVHAMRGRMDAVIVGAGTAAADDPRLTCRHAPVRREATRVVVCGGTAPSPDSALIDGIEEAPVALAHREDACPDGLERAVEAGCEALPLQSNPSEPAGVDCGALLDELGHRDMSNVLIEGGSEILGSFFDDGLIDRAWVFVAPRVVGGREAVHAVGGHGVETIDKGAAMLGTTEQGEPASPPAEPSVRVSLSGNDILIRGWTTDPRYFGEREEGSE